jgi:hypothetical protein
VICYNLATVSDYRDDRGALRERTAELEEQLDAERAQRERATTELAEKEAELRELRVRVGDLRQPPGEQPKSEAWVAPRRRDVDPGALEQMRKESDQQSGWPRAMLQAGILLATSLTVAMLYLDGAKKYLNPGALLLVVMVFGALAAAIWSWRRKM